MTISAQIIKDSISPDGIRLTTMLLRYPRFIHSEFMTHRLFSRNASSSRAIPIERMIKDVLEDPAMPIHWGAAQKGMQAERENDAPVVVNLYDEDDTALTFSNKDAWLRARDNAVRMAEAFAEAGYHKQIVNRILEPFAHITVVVTATEWSNFYALRRHKDAQPEIKALADCMYQEKALSVPKELGFNDWHLPFITDAEEANARIPTEDLIKMSVARCARTSYLTHDKQNPSREKDIALHDMLVVSQPVHASPAEHQARPDSKIGPVLWRHPDLHGNLRGWIQYRKKLPNESA